MESETRPSCQYLWEQKCEDIIIFEKTRWKKTKDKWRRHKQTTSASLQIKRRGQQIFENLLQLKSVSATLVKPAEIDVECKRVTRNPPWLTRLRRPHRVPRRLWSRPPALRTSRGRGLTSARFPQEWFLSGHAWNHYWLDNGYFQYDFSLFIILNYISYHYPLLTLSSLLYFYEYCKFYEWVQSTYFLRIQ